MGCGDSKSSSGQTPRPAEQQPNKFDRTDDDEVEFDLTETDTQLENANTRNKQNSQVELQSVDTPVDLVCGSSSMERVNPQDLGIALSEMDSQSTKSAKNKPSPASSSTTLYEGSASPKWKRTVAEKNAANKGSQQNTTGMKDARNTRNTKGKRNKAIKEPVNEKGYKKRIRENLRQAATGSDIEEIENAIALFEKNKLEDNGDLEDAQERLEFLYLRKEIRDAILRRHQGILDKAIANVESSQYRSELMHYLENAKKLKEHLGELNRFSHDILQMEQETISEIRSYHHPPKGVKEVMLSTYLVLGYEESKLREWTDIQCLLGRYGKESLMREIRNADTVNLDEHTCKRVEHLQKDFTIDDIRVVSNGAAAFYLWNQNMTRKYSKDRQRSSASTNPPPAANRKKNKG